MSVKLGFARSIAALTTLLAVLVAAHEISSHAYLAVELQTSKADRVSLVSMLSNGRYIVHENLVLPGRSIQRFVLTRRALRNLAIVITDESNTEVLSAAILDARGDQLQRLSTIAPPLAMQAAPEVVVHYPALDGWVAASFDIYGWHGNGRQFSWSVFFAIFSCGVAISAAILKVPTLPIFDFVERRSYLGTLLICLAILIARGWYRLRLPELWAEDGSVFLEEFQLFGVLSLFKPYGGYLHIVPRALSALVYTTPESAWPLNTALASIMILAASLAYVGSRGLAWLLPTGTARLLTGAALCMGCGLTEIIGNATNLHWALCVFAGLVLLADESHWTRFTTLAFTLAVISAGESVILTPLAACRTYECRHTHRSRRYATMMLAVVTSSTALNLLLNISETKTRHSLAIAARASFGTLVRLQVLQPVVGLPIASALMQNVLLCIALCSLIALAFHRALLSLDAPRRARVGLFVAAFVALPALIATARPENADRFIVPLPDIEGRYVFVPITIGILLWCVVATRLFQSPSVRARFVSGAITLSIFAACINQRFALAPLTLAPQWAQRIADGACETAERIPIAPQGWTAHCSTQLRSNR